MLNRRELGLKFENKAIDILKMSGYKIVEHTSVEKEIAPYDIIAEKEGKLYFIEVKGRSGSNNDFQIRREQMMAYSYIEDVHIFLVNDEDFRFFNILDSGNKGLLGGFHLNLGLNIETLIMLRSDIKESINREGVGDIKKLRSLGKKLIIVFSEDNKNYHNLKEGDYVDISDIVKKDKKKVFGSVVKQTMKEIKKITDEAK